MTQRLERDIELAGTTELIDLLEEVRAYPVTQRNHTDASAPRSISSDVAIPLELQVGDDVRRFWSTTTVFGTPIDITLSELAIESFFPADAETARALGLRAER